MAGFPWAWFLISTGFSMLLQEHLEKWLAERFSSTNSDNAIGILLVASEHPPELESVGDDSADDDDDDIEPLSSIGSSSGESSSE